MTSNALTDIPWIPLEAGSKVSNVTVRDTLLSAHEKGVFLDKKVPGYALGSQLRILRDTLAVTLRHEEGYVPGREKKLASRILKEGLSQSAVDQGLKDLEAGADLFSATFPFLQRPALKLSSAKDSARLLAPGKKPVKKLLPAMPADQGEDFWNLAVAQKNSLEIVEAVRNLAVHHHYSMAGNNTYDGEKCAMGSPGIRFPGKGHTATEIFWEEESLLATLLQSLPKTWVQGEGLPAWADRLGKTALLDDGTEHPLWAGTWSSNTAVCLWEDERLVGVRTGGIPEEWYLPTMGKAKELRKNWWDQRNTRDPFYLYIKNQKGELKAQRLDIGRDATDLAVEWASEHKTVVAQDLRSACFYSSSESKLAFIRHQIEGTSTSPSIRASQVYIPDSDRWSFGQNLEVQELIQLQAHVLQEMHTIICSPFRRKTKEDKKRAKEGYPPPVLDDLEQLRQDASNHYWRFITPVYKEFLRCDRAEDGYLPDSLLKEAVDAAIAAYDATVMPYRNQYAARIEHVRGLLQYRLHKAMNIIKETPDQEETDDE